MFDERLKNLRKNKGLNMKKTAEMLGIPYTTYVGYEKNEREPNSETLLQLASFFGCSVDYLIGRTNQVETDKPKQNEQQPTKSPATKEDLKFALFNGSEGITDEMYEEVKAFAELVKLREEQKKGKK